MIDAKMSPSSPTPGRRCPFTYLWIIMQKISISFEVERKLSFDFLMPFIVLRVHSIYESPPRKLIFFPMFVARYPLSVFTVSFFATPLPWWTLLHKISAFIQLKSFFPLLKLEPKREQKNEFPLCHHPCCALSIKR